MKHLTGPYRQRAPGPHETRPIFLLMSDAGRGRFPPWSRLFETGSWPAAPAPRACSPSARIMVCLSRGRHRREAVPAVPPMSPAACRRAHRSGAIARCSMPLESSTCFRSTRACAEVFPGVSQCCCSTVREWLSAVIVDLVDLRGSTEQLGLRVYKDGRHPLPLASIALRTSQFSLQSRCLLSGL